MLPRERLTEISCAARDRNAARNPGVRRTAWTALDSGETAPMARSSNRLRVLGRLKPLEILARLEKLCLRSVEGRIASAARTGRWWFWP